LIFPVYMKSMIGFPSYQPEDIGRNFYSDSLSVIEEIIFCLHQRILIFSCRFPFREGNMADVSRRDLLKLSGVAAGVAALGGALSGCSSDSSAGADPTQQNSLLAGLEPYTPGTESLAADEMRITFLGTSCIPRLSQECNSVFVEVGSGDQFVFDCGTGVVAKYNAMGIPMSKMNKIFLTHLHGDHMSDLTHIYCFGPAEDRKSPLYLWGPNNSNFTYTDLDGNKRGPYEDGTKAFCEKFREVMRWHTESFSFGSTGFVTNPSDPATWGLPGPAVRVGDDDPNDGYALVPIELDWTQSQVAYNNATTGVKITSFPVIHCRRGSIGYKIEWNGMSMVFTGDTKPNYTVINQAKGVDVLIHEMVVPADVWAMKNMGITNPNQVDQATWQQAYNYALSVQDSSHTPQGAFGYILSQITPPPRLTVATHFQAADDTMASALQSVRKHYPVGDVTFAADFMVFNVTKTKIRQRRAVVSEYAFYPVAALHPVNTPIYWTYDKATPPNKVSNPYAQIDQADEVPQKDPVTDKDNWDPTGY
jgi:ribonuclease Z